MIVIRFGYDYPNIFAEENWQFITWKCSRNLAVSKMLALFQEYIFAEENK